MSDKERLETIKELVKNIESILYDEWRQQELTILIESLYYADHVDWLINRVEELEEENRELNMEIGTYSSKIDEIQRSIGVKLADLKILSTQMLKGDSK